MILNPGDVVTVDFPSVTGVKRRPAVVVSSATYHLNRPDIIVGLITTQTTALGVTDYVLQDWQASSRFTGCVCFSEFHCDVAFLCQPSLLSGSYQSVIGKAFGLVSR